LVTSAKVFVQNQRSRIDERNSLRHVVAALDLDHHWIRFLGKGFTSQKLLWMQQIWYRDVKIAKDVPKTKNKLHR
jgi:hypothetical protein